MKHVIDQICAWRDQIFTHIVKQHPYVKRLEAQVIGFRSGLSATGTTLEYVEQDYARANSCLMMIKEHCDKTNRPMGSTISDMIRKHYEND